MGRKRELDFALFFAVWAQQQGWEVPDFHWEIIKFLDDSENWNNATGVIQIFRGAGKSTFLGLWIVYMLVKDPALRFLIMSVNQETAKKITKDCLSIIRRHPLAHDLKGAEGTWRADHFSVRGNPDARNPSVSAFGANSNVTSARADFVVFDDVEAPRTCATEALRDNLRDRINETTHLLIPQTGRQLFVGTPHHFISIYPEQVELGASSLFLPLIINPEGEFPFLTGESRWPDRFDQTTISERQLKSKSKGNFLSQYQLIPYTVDDSILDPTLLQHYDEEIKFAKANGVHYATIGDHRIVSVSAFWDVALSKAKGDDSVLAIVFTSDQGHIFIHRTLLLSGEVDEQCQQVKEAALEFNLPLIIVEANGVGAFVPQILIKHTRGLHIGVDGRMTTKNKAQKIIEAYEVPLSGGFLHIHESVANSKFIGQLKDFNPKTLNADHDDFIDAPAGAIDNEPIRIGKGAAVGDRKMEFWGDYNGPVEAAVEMATLH